MMDLLLFVIAKWAFLPVDINCLRYGISIHIRPALCLQYIGVCSTTRDVPYTGGYHEYNGEYHECMGDIMSTSGTS